MSTLTQNTSAMSVSANSTTGSSMITRDSSPRRRVSGLSVHPDQENTDGSFEPELGSPSRSSRRSKPRTPTSSPTRNIPSPSRSDVLSPSNRPSPRSPSEGSSRGRRQLGEGTLISTVPRGLHRLTGDDLLHELSRSLIENPAKSSPFSPSKKGDATLDGRPNLEHKVVNTPRPSTGKSATSSWRTVAPQDDRVDGSLTHVDELDVGREGDSMSNPIIIPSDESQLKIPFSKCETSPFPSKKNCSQSPKRRRKRVFEGNDEEEEEATSTIKASKRMRLDTLGKASPRDLTGRRLFDCDSSDQGSYSASLQASFDLETLLKHEEPIVDDLLSEALDGNDENQQHRSILPDWFDQRECTSLDFNAAQPVTSELYFEAFMSLIDYIRAINDNESSLELRREARTTMSNAWSQWQMFAMAPITMEDLRAYGSKLDADGRRALAAALRVRSDQLQSWFDEPRQVVAFTTTVFMTAPPRDPSPSPTDPQPSTPTRTAPLSVDPAPTSPSPTTDIVSTPSPLPALIPASLPTSVTATNQPIIFGKTPEARVVAKKDHQPGQPSGDLPRWAEKFHYCDSHTDLMQWIRERHAHLTQATSSSSPPFQGMTPDKEQRVLHELTDGKGLAHPFTQKEGRHLERKACAVLPSDQSPLLLDGEVAARMHKGSGEAPLFVLYCRANFSVDWESGITYKDRVCGTTFRTDESAIRHLREKHLTVKRPKAS